MTPAVICAGRGFSCNFDTRPGRWDINQNYNDKVKEYSSLLCNGDGNKRHQRCLRAFQEHGSQVCADVPGKRHPNPEADGDEREPSSGDVCRRTSAGIQTVAAQTRAGSPASCYASAPKLMGSLKVAKTKGTLESELKKIERCPLLILDDLFLVPMDAKERPLLLDIIEDRHERKSIVVTSDIAVCLSTFHRACCNSNRNT